MRYPMSTHLVFGLILDLLSLFSIIFVINGIVYTKRRILVIKVEILPVIIINWVQRRSMAQAIKSLWKISRALEQTFKQLTYYTARHLAHSKTYGADFLDEYKRISAKIQKEKDKDRIKRNKNFKNQKDQLKKKLQEAKARNEEKEQERRQKRTRRDRGSSGSHSSSNSVQMQSDDQRPNNQREKDKARAVREKKELKAVEKRKDDLRESLELDYERDFDFNRPYKSQSKKDSMEEQRERKRERKRQPKARVNSEKITKWSERNPLSLSCTDSEKYKILAVDEQNSDFEDENALLKAPQIKPREPLTPYFLFLRKNRYSILKGFPVIHEKGNFGEIWKNLREEEKKPYQDQYIRAQQIYAKKMAQYYAVNPRSVEERNRVMQEVEEAANQEQEKLEAQNKKPQSKSKAKTSQTGKGRGGKGGRGRKKDLEKDNIYEE